MNKSLPAYSFLILTLLTGCLACSPRKSTPSTHYSPLTQIDTTNVQNLQVAWTYHTGDADTINHSQIQCPPLVVDSVVYGTSPRLVLFALDAATGKAKWTFNPQDSNQNKSRKDFALNNNRGVAYWKDGNDRRIFYSAGPWLYAIDANTGKVIPSFGKEGKIDLHDGLGRDVHDLYVVATSPGIVYKDLLIMGTRVSEGSDAAPGHLRAYDTRTGEIKWIFHTIPQPGEYGYDTWEDPNAWKHIGGANAWSGFSLDEKRGILYAPLGSASFDFYGGMRKGQGLFSDCLLALDAATGKRIWHFQDIHHDTWDKDLPTPPALVTVMHNGQWVDAVAQPTKTGFVFLLDRETGASLFPIEEKPVPTNTALTGEKLWPTQPFPSLPKPFVRQTFTDSDVNDLLPDSSIQDIKNRLKGYHTGNMFNPQSKEGTIILPGLDGGAEWGGPAFDPATGLLYVNANEMPWIITITDVTGTSGSGQAPAGRSAGRTSSGTGQASLHTYLEAGKQLYRQNCISCHGPERKGGGNYPSLLGVGKKYNEQQFADLVMNGRRMMPAFKQLSGNDRAALASFILDIKSQQQKEFTAPAAPLDSFLNLPYTITGYNKFLSKEGYPAIKPPWGTLNAINLNTGDIAWKIPLGEYPEFAKKGIITGTENYGGPVVTAGGLVFIAATRDGKIRAFNKATGRLLWQADLPAPGFATPAIYSAGGKQFIVIACGGGKLGTHSADTYVAFALPPF
ncbi:MAG TPA: PQQ-binding-like beta-propeller repeat protein [Puia sp.]|nr:PQQ-binding-like beta-propeller repeat protein [Puia sp.]